MTFVINLGLALLGGPLLAGVVRKMVKAQKTWSRRPAWCCGMPLW